MVTSGQMASVALTQSYLGLSDDVQGDLIESMGRHAEAVARGDLTGVEEMLLHQAVATQSMFARLALQAKSQSTLQATQVYTQLALKAQSNSRATIEALIEAKRPKQIAFVRQANLAQNQQVNNGVPPPRERKKRDVPNELIVEEADGGKKVDRRVAKAASRTNSKAKTLVPVDRATEH